VSEKAVAESSSPAPRRPDPVVERDNAFFWEAAKRGELVSRTCDGCGFMTHPPVPMCPKCHGVAWSEKKLSGKGVVTNWMRSHYPPVPLFDYPLLIVTVKLDEGLELASNLIDADDIEGDYAGVPVEVTFAPTRSGWAVPVFRPSGRAS
jgi:uncharacterized OB-fold protein